MSSLIHFLFFTKLGAIIPFVIVGIWGAYVAYRYFKKSKP